ncbi:MAG: energy-coupling factor ABC transporter ATP-binding protein [Bacilli bacterium]|nr:energy-coupling factor ABC transporter ATP-binding protein [Bacilli bacterium]
MNIIEAKNINYTLGTKLLFKNINISIEKGSFVSFIGENGVGKTTLLRLLSGSIFNSNNNIKMDGIQINKYNIEEVMRKTAFITTDNEFFSKTVMNEILQDKNNVSIYDTNEVRNLLDDFGLLYLESFPPQKLSYAENQIVALIKAIVNKPKIIFLDNAFSKLDNDKREELLDYLCKYSKENDITLIGTTNSILDLKHFNRIIILKNHGISFDGSYDELIENVDLLKEGFKIPWELEVSNKLMLYDLIDKEFDSIDEIVGELCR